MHQGSFAIIGGKPSQQAISRDGSLPLHVFASVSFNAREQRLLLRR
jgi:hypothetical protein